MDFNSLQNGQAFQVLVQGVTVTATVQVLNSGAKLLTCTGGNGVDVLMQLKQKGPGLLSVLEECNFTYMSRVVFVELSKFFQVGFCVAKENWRSIVNRFFKQDPNTVLFTDLPFQFKVVHSPRPLIKSLQLLKKHPLPLLESCDFIVQASHPAACSFSKIVCPVPHPKVEKSLKIVAFYFQYLVCALL